MLILRGGATASGAISHYDVDDIELAKVLKNISGEIVVVSDPLTMANMRGLGGHNSLLLFTNLDTGAMQGKLALHSYLKKLIVPSGDINDIKCPTVSETIGALAMGQAPDLTYTFSWLSSLHKARKKILAETGYSNSLSLTLTGRPEGIVGTPNGHSFATLIRMVGTLPAAEEAQIRFAVVLKKRTAAWVAPLLPPSQSYFDTHVALDQKLLGVLTQKCGAILNAGAAIIVFNPDGTAFNER